MKTDSTPSSAAISNLAYQLWEKAGKPDGRSEEFWHQAETQLRATPAPSASSSGAPTSSATPAATAPKAPAARKKKRASTPPPSV